MKTETLALSADEDLIVQVNAKGHVDIRTYVYDARGNSKPTKRGISIPPAVLDELLILLKQAKKEIAAKSVPV
ncbi:MAG: transcriptional coactivator p15/PC4 family protein [Nitrospirota bacterium]